MCPQFLSLCFPFNMILHFLLITGVSGQIASEQNFPGNKEKTSPWFGPGLKPPAGFPLELTLTNFENWAHDILTCFVWTAYPQNGDDVVAATNWAAVNKYDLHASGNMHSWSPLTLAKTEDHPQLKSCGIGISSIDQALVPHRSSRVILLKTGLLTQMQVTSTQPRDSYFWTEPGVLMVDLMQELEENGLGILAIPAPGHMTIGGVLAVGGHGTGVEATGETLSKGNTYGSISNLIMSFTVVVYDATEGEYILKEFQRTDPEAKAYMVNLGRTFVTNITLRAGPLEYLRCRSHIDIPASKLFAATAGPNSISRLLDDYGRLETITFPFTTHPWLKVWSVEPEKPILSREVTGPYNYPFSDLIPEPAALIIKAMVENKLYNLTRLIGKIQYASTVAGLVATNSLDIWGASKNTLLYVRSTTARYNENGYAVLTARRNVQRVVHETYTFYYNSLLAYEAQGLYPINGPLEIRVTGLDRPEDVLIEGAQGAAMSALNPVEGSDFDVAVWVALASFLQTPSSCRYMKEFEDFLFGTFNGDWAEARVEWSKGWAFTGDGPWTNKSFFDVEIKKSLSRTNYDYFVETTVAHDPYYVFTNEFTRSYFV